MQFQGKIMVITGAAGILGGWTAAYFAKLGAKLCLSDIRMDALEKVAADLALDPKTTLLHATELTSNASMLDLVELVRREWKAPDILVNNAGIYTRYSLLGMEFADWDRVFGVNLRAPFVLTREMAKLMIAEKKKGSIINISSGAARKMNQNSVPYCTSKTALERLSKGFCNGARALPHPRQRRRTGFCTGQRSVDAERGLRHQHAEEHPAWTRQRPGDCTRRDRLSLLGPGGLHHRRGAERGRRQLDWHLQASRAGSIGRRKLRSNSMSDPTPLLPVDNLTIEIGGASVVDGISFDMAPGKVMALVGESGCGKSLTSYAILGLLLSAAKRTSGRIRLQELELSALSERHGIRVSQCHGLCHKKVVLGDVQNCQTVPDRGTKKPAFTRA